MFFFWGKWMLNTIPPRSPPPKKKHPPGALPPLPPPQKKNISQERHRDTPHGRASQGSLVKPLHNLFR